MLIPIMVFRSLQFFDNFSKSWRRWPGPLIFIALIFGCHAIIPNTHFKWSDRLARERDKKMEEKKGEKVTRMQNNFIFFSLLFFIHAVLTEYAWNVLYFVDICVLYTGCS